jgi:hypothetical protein
MAPWNSAADNADSKRGTQSATTGAQPSSATARSNQPSHSAVRRGSPSASSGSKRDGSTGVTAGTPGSGVRDQRSTSAGRPSASRASHPMGAWFTNPLGSSNPKAASRS